MKRNVANLIEEKRTSVCLLELSDMVSVGICECSLDMAEKLALEKSLSKSTGIYTYHRSECTF